MEQPTPVTAIANECFQELGRADQTRRGITAARARGVVWGRAGKETAAKNRAAALVFAESLRSTLTELMASGARSPKYIAELLNKRGLKSPSGGRWHSMTVIRLLERLGPSLKEEVATAKQIKRMAVIMTETFAIEDAQIKQVKAYVQLRRRSRSRGRKQTKV